MPFYIIKANGKRYDEVYCERAKPVAEVKKEYQLLLKTDNIKVTRVVSKG